MSDQTKFYDIYDYLYIPFWQTTTFFVIMLCLLLVASGIGVYFLVKHLRKKAAKVPEIMPWEWALGELKKLAPGRYETKDEFKQFYFELTRIAKLYLQKRFEWDLVEKTDNQLISYLKAQKCNKNVITSLESVLQGSLLIKFANAQALREQAQTDLKTVISLIKKTKPRKKANL